jgi:hypothetical protein
MSDYFQITVTEAARGALDQESKDFLAEMGWYEEDMARWIIVSPEQAEDYFDIDAADITNGIRNFESPLKLIMHFEEVGQSRESLTVDFLVREVAPLIRQGNSDKGYIVPDDIAYQMERELTFLADEAIPPGTGNAVNWFRAELARFLGSN